MLSPVPMAKVAVVGPMTQLEATVASLHELGVLHIEDYQPGEEGFELGRPLPQGARVSERLLRIRGLIKGANLVPPAPGAKFSPEGLRGVQERLRAVEEELAQLIGRRSELVDGVKALEEERAILGRVQNFPLSLDLVQGYASVATATGFVAAGTDLTGLRAVHADAEVESSNEAEGLFVFAVVPKGAERALQEALSRLRFQPVELPPVAATPVRRLAALEEEGARARSQLLEVEDRIRAMGEQHAGALFALDEQLSLEADRATAPVRFRTTKNAFMIEGWVPREDLARLRMNVETASRRSVFVAELPTPLTQPWKHERLAHPAPVHGGGHAAGEHEAGNEGRDAAHPAAVEEPPVALAPAKPAGAYVLLTDTYSRPKYSEIDPTLFFYFGFPFFFGLMLGDVAYGALLLLLVAVGVFNKIYDFFGFESQRQLNKIFRHCAYSSIVFGFLFSEFFGLELFGPKGLVNHYTTHWGPIPFPLSRFENVKLLLLLSLTVAAIHMVIGLLVGIRNGAVAHGIGHAWKHRGSWLFILLAAFVAGAAVVPGTLAGNGQPAEPGAAKAFDPLPSLVVHDRTPLYAAAGVLFAIGLVLLLAGEGGIALLELPTILSNLLSYTRLVAIGLSGAGIALAGNNIVGLLLRGHPGVGAWIGAVLVAVFFHGLNLALGVLGPALHSLRLHYVEFFTKFYEGGGATYAPFRSIRRYTAKEVKQA